MSQTRVVIVGAGFGGLAVARQLLHSKVSSQIALTVIDQKTESVYTPWLHEIAAGMIADEQDAEIALESLRGARFLRGSVVGIDRTTRHVLLDDDATVSFDVLVCALGSIPHDFGTKGARAFGLGLKEVQDAEVVRDRFEAMVAEVKKGKRQRLFVIGAGANGLELLTDLAAFVLNHPGLEKYFSFDCVDAGTEFLPMLPKFLRQYTAHRLEKLHIRTHLSTSLREVQKDAVVLQPLRKGLPDGDVVVEHCDGCIVTLGVKVPDVLKDFVFATNERGRALVDQSLRIHGESGIFALGDCAALIDVTPDPQTAAVAMEQANVVAKNIVALIRNKPVQKYHQKKHRDIIVTLGGRDGVGKVFGIPVWGYTTVILHRLIDARYFFFMTSPVDALLRMYRACCTYGNTKKRSHS